MCFMIIVSQKGSKYERAKYFPRCYTRKITDPWTYLKYSIQVGDVFCHDCMLFDSVAGFLGNIQRPKTIVSGNVLVSSQKTNISVFKLVLECKYFWKAHCLFKYSCWLASTRWIFVIWVLITYVANRAQTCNFIIYPTVYVLLKIQE